MSKKRVRPQKPKDMGNRALYDAMMDIRRSSATVPHRNRARYNRNDYRSNALRGKYDG
jgi:hypothetical protein